MTAPIALILHGLGHDPATGVATFAPALPAGMWLSALAGSLPFAEGKARAWFGVSFTDAGPVADVAQAAASRDAVIAAAERAVEPVLLLGFGQGGVVALAAFLARPDLFVGCAVASGRVLTELLPDAAPAPGHRGKPVFWTHGSADPAIAFGMAEAGRAMLNDYGVALSIFDHDGGHELPLAAAGTLRDWIATQLDQPAT